MTKIRLKSSFSLHHTSRKQTKKGARKGKDVKSVRTFVRLKFLPGGTNDISHKTNSAGFQDCLLLAAASTRTSNFVTCDVQSSDVQSSDVQTFNHLLL